MHALLSNTSSISPHPPHPHHLTHPIPPPPPPYLFGVRNRRCIPIRTFPVVSGLQRKAEEEGTRVPHRSSGALLRTRLSCAPPCWPRRNDNARWGVGSAPPRRTRYLFLRVPLLPLGGRATFPRGKIPPPSPYRRHPRRMAWRGEPQSPRVPWRRAYQVKRR